MIDISIIIPAYNIEKVKLERCFQSIYEQMTKNIEVVVIDDGSAEPYAGDTKLLAQKYSFKLIRRTNGGISVARNNGIEASRGKYIMFVDADDFLEKDSIIRGYELAEKYNADVVLGGINIVDNNKIKECKISGGSELIYNKTDIGKLQKYMLAIRCEKNSSELSGLRCVGPWSKIIRKDFLDNIRFDESLLLYEDLMFNLTMLDKASLVVIDNSIWYNYMIYSQSSIHKYKKNGIEIMMYALDKLDNLLDVHTDWGAAVSIKTFECLRRAFENTVCHKDNKEAKKISTIKNVLNNERVIRLLGQYDKNIYQLTKKEKILWTVFTKKLNFAVFIFYRLKQYKK